MIPLLAASEQGRGQTESPFEKKVEMWWEIRLSQWVKLFWKEGP